MSEHHPLQEVRRQPRIAIIGGGISGLAAAHEFQRLVPDWDVHLLERSSRLGGVLRTTRQDGYLIEHAADNFLADPSLPWMLRLCQRLGIDDRLVPTDPRFRRALVVKRGELHPVPAGFRLMLPTRVWPLLSTPLLSLPGKLRMCSEWMVGRAALDRDESLAEFATRRFGREAFEWLIEPLIAGIYTADAERLSVAAALPQFVQFERQYGSLTRAAWNQRRLAHARGPESGARYGAFLGPIDGMSSLIELLANALPQERLHLNTSVTSLTRTPDGSSGPRWQLSLSRPTERAANELMEFDGVLLAASAPALVPLLGPVDRGLAAELAGIEHASSAVVCLGYREADIRHPLDAFGLVVPRAEGRRTLSISFSSRKFAGRAPAGEVLLRVFIGGALRADLAELDDNQLTQIALDETTELLGASGRPRTVLIQRWPKAMPQYHVGHLARLQRIEERIKGLSNLQLTSNAQRGVGMPQCVRDAEQAAGRIVDAVTAAWESMRQTG
ncbi:MAG: protoporphyrinogen oxidase [Pirellulales bacterium]